MKQEGKFILMNREEHRVYVEGLKGTKTFKTIQQHHTASPAYKDVKNNHFQLMRSMENYHVGTLKMNEIAQHFSTFPDGTICVGRPKQRWWRISESRQQGLNNYSKCG